MNGKYSHTMNMWNNYLDFQDVDDVPIKIIIVIKIKYYIRSGWIFTTWYKQVHKPL